VIFVNIVTCTVLRDLNISIGTGFKAGQLQLLSSPPITDIHPLDRMDSFGQHYSVV